VILKTNSGLRLGELPELDRDSIDILDSPRVGVGRLRMTWNIRDREFYLDPGSARLSA
jgi:hypothetical protein